jgi:hypothetical protein
MKYRIDSRYVWYDRGTRIVLMYFIQGLPFTFDDVPDDGLFNLELIELADNQKRWKSLYEVHEDYSSTSIIPYISGINTVLHTNYTLGFI